MSNITFADEGWEEYLYWQQKDKKTLKKINDLLKSIDRDGALIVVTSKLTEGYAVKYNVLGSNMLDIIR